MRDASNTIAVMLLGALLGIAGFVSIDRWTRTTYQPPAFEQVITEPDAHRSEDSDLFAEDHEPESSRTGLYRNCREARAAGDAPLYLGDPGYSEYMDGDGDGIACEPHRRR